MENLANKNAVVTGASSGIGQATAVALAKEGCNVALLARKEDKLKGTLQSYRKFVSIILMLDR
jgi:3-oxoacyl-[acyl-carrier protein] reductase